MILEREKKEEREAEREGSVDLCSTCLGPHQPPPTRALTGHQTSSSGASAQCSKHRCHQSSVDFIELHGDSTSTRHPQSSLMS